MKYKLGSQLQVDPITDEEKFEYNLCWLNNDGSVLESVYLGVLTTYDPVVYKARELVKMLNGENV